MTKEQILEKNNNVRIFDHFYDGKQNITVERALKAMEEYAQQEVAKEREKAKKLVEALEEIADMTGNILIYKKAKQSLTEYEL
jgi:predicted component of type VI protein secretion system